MLRRIFISRQLTSWHTFAWTSALLALLIGCSQQPSVDPSRPNVIVILTDDQGYGDMSAHGNPILKTPSMDRLHDESVRLTDFHVASVCTPTRGELMTGLYSLRNKAGMVPAGRNLMRRDIRTMPEIFAENGYATGLFGKWHLGDTYPHRPLDRGFQRAVWHKGWGLASEIEYDNDLYYTRYLDQEETRFSDRFCANQWFDSAMDWMGQQSDSGQPFFAYIALNTPHYPFHALARDFARYRDAVDDFEIAGFFGLIQNIDDNLARLDKWMTAKGLRDNTLLVFFNDNGTAKGETVFNAGMRGKKGSPYEGGHRAICFIRWPGGDLGSPRAVSYPSHVTDLLPTFIDLLDFEGSEDVRFDGASLASVLRSESGEGPDRKIIVQYGGRQRPAKYSDGSVIWNNWRLVGESELYDIATDPGQQANVAEQNPDVVKAMQAHYEEYWTEISPSVEVVEPHLVRADPATFLELTSNNWIEVDCDNRTRTAEACGPPRGGPWQIEVEQEGDYSVSLSRWPFHLERDLTALGPQTTIGGAQISVGKALPITSAQLSVNGGTPVTEQSTDGATAITFSVPLQAGRSTLQGWFRDRSGSDLVGAYYARIQRIQ